MEEEDGVGNDSLALAFSQMAGADANSVDLVGRLKNLSAGRKKLMTKYFHLEEGESWPLLSEYFAVALAFVALGAMVREANVRMRRKEKESSDDVPPKLQRMALDSMLKSAMERLRGLARRTQTLDEKVRDRSYMEAAFQFERLEFLKRISALEVTIAKKDEAEAALRREKDDLIKRVADVDAQRGYFFKKMAEAEAALGDLQRLRMEDGKANNKLVEIYAGREQSWKSERIRMRREIEVLKERVNKLLLQAQMMPSQSSFDAAAEALKLRNLKRRAKEVVREKLVSGRELSAVADKSEVDSRSSKEPSVSGNDRRDADGADMHELTAAQNQEMDAELAIILKRVGAIKRRGTSGSRLDELLNEAKDKPKLKRLGSFDQAPKGMVVDDPLLCRPEAHNVRGVEIGKIDELLNEAKSKFKFNRLGSFGAELDKLDELHNEEANNARNVEIDKRDEAEANSARDVELVKLHELNLDELKLDELKLDELRLDERKLDEVKLDEVKLDEVKLDEVKLDELRLDERKLDEVKLDEVKLDEVKLDEVKLDEVKLDEVKLDEVKLDEVKLDEVKLDELRLDERKLDEVKLDEVNEEANNVRIVETDKPYELLNEVEKHPERQLKCFSWEELQVASDNFNNMNILGRGVFGKVYKGRLADGTQVVIKRFEDERSTVGELQYQTEVEMISTAVHRNLLRPRGFCITPTERLLVYPYMPNGSVASRLQGRLDGEPVLSWRTRKQIGLGTARGLSYLHDHCNPKIIHRGVKAADILLDEDFEAVVGDFGLAKLVDYEDTHVTSSAVPGETIGRIAPDQYLSTRESSENTDVFGFGIMLLELITGQCTHDDDAVLLDWVKGLLRERKVDLPVDPNLKQDYDQKEVEELIQVALLCTQRSPLDRPKMRDVLRMIEEDGLAERWQEWQKLEGVRNQEDAHDQVSTPGSKEHDLVRIQAASSPVIDPSQLDTSDEELGTVLTTIQDDVHLNAEAKSTDISSSEEDAEREIIAEEHLKESLEEDDEKIASEISSLKHGIVSQGGEVQFSNSESDNDIGRSKELLAGENHAQAPSSPCKPDSRLSEIGS